MTIEVIFDYVSIGLPSLRKFLWKMNFPKFWNLNCNHWFIHHQEIHFLGSQRTTAIFWWILNEPVFDSIFFPTNKLKISFYQFLIWFWSIMMFVSLVSMIDIYSSSRSNWSFNTENKCRIKQTFRIKNIFETQSFKNIM